MRLESLRFGSGCSASFVSPQGLILTNHHCARDAIAEAQGNADWVRDGFVARELGDEVPLPGLTVQQLVGMQDVTAQVEDGVGPDLDPAAAEERREANRQRILAAATAADGKLQPQLVKLFQGGVWQLYQYRVYDDIRLVMAPHLQTSHFGGDPDNFVYPRYAIDFTFCRAWVDGKPADTAACHFPWSDGPDEHELVFLTGNPGGTKRLLTQAQLEYQRDARYPRIRELIDARLAILREFSAKDAEREKQLRTGILRFENGQKLYRGEYAALADPAFMARKGVAEQAFKQRVEQMGRGPELAVWDELARWMERKRALEGPVNFQSAGGSPLLLRALALLEFAAGGDPANAQKARDTVVEDEPLQRALFVDHLERARRWLPADDPYLAAVLGDGTTAAAAERLAGIALGDATFVARLIEGGAAAIAACDDHALAVARVIAQCERRNQAEQKAIDAAEADAGARIARLLFAAYGDQVSPDATFTLRFSDGRVEGYPYNGTVAPWRTVFHGLFARHAEFGGVHPFDLPREWLLAKDRIDMQAPIDFVSTVDSTGGNSGSPVINARAELVGLLFDGNIESLANEFLYGERVERSVCVHPQAIVEALRKVYLAERLLREIGR